MILAELVVREYAAQKILAFCVVAGLVCFLYICFLWYTMWELSDGAPGRHRQGARRRTSCSKALSIGRNDPQFFSRFFLSRTLTDAQAEYVENANATVNVLPTSNRWGKTTVLSNIHYRG
jgi:hypothetical protein